MEAEYSETYFVCSDNYTGKSQLRKYRPATFTIQDVVNSQKQTK
jgi:hypothetical protein